MVTLFTPSYRFRGLPCVNGYSYCDSSRHIMGVVCKRSEDLQYNIKVSAVFAFVRQSRLKQGVHMQIHQVVVSASKE